MATAWTLRTGGAEDLDLVEPLWVAVHHRHQESMPELAPYVSDAETWQARQEAVRGTARQARHPVFCSPSSTTRPIGYGLTHVFAMADTWIEDTWRTGDRIGEIESLSVLPDYRGSGLGTQLLERLEDHLHERGVDDMILGALAGNADAIRLYERRGYRPTWLYLSKFAGRGRSSR